MEELGFIAFTLRLDVYVRLRLIMRMRVLPLLLLVRVSEPPAALQLNEMSLATESSC